MTSALDRVKQMERRAQAAKEANFEFAQGDLLPPIEQEDVTKSLPEWSEAVRGVPNAILRGALFAAIQGKTRRYLKGEVVEQSDGFRIQYTGMQLDQSDLDVWETLVHISRHLPQGDKIFFKANNVLSYLGRPNGGDHYRWLSESIDRMVACSIKITLEDRYTYASNLLKVWRDTVTQEYVVQMDQNLLSLYSHGWTQINWRQRDALRGKPIALWLHGWYCSHSDPEDITIERIMTLCGSGAAQKGSFKTRLKAGLADLKSIGAIQDFNITRKGLVQVVKHRGSAVPGFLL
ncbi:plasmid replication initiator TrfA [Pseudomonas luteola]|uniref:plasmid replication initiator TrfA n=1 Tax=Pseudomonas luteola TaxID=47886 RepID=UPI00289ADC3F|nr:plasmid replication initiator TrfA [Pseudomonas luteola]